MRFQGPPGTQQPLSPFGHKKIGLPHKQKADSGVWPPKGDLNSCFAALTTPESIAYRRKWLLWSCFAALAAPKSVTL